ncbi:MAG: response regulator [Anaerolineae bacterium]|nr:response regulator [Gloeobacterales cyanobacterium ES-bin-313]
MGNLVILIVDDHSISRQVSVMQFARLGYCALAVESGLEALAALETTDFEMVLMDIRMPPPDGFETTRLIRQMSEPQCRIPIAAVTADLMRCTREICLEAGVDDVIYKPVSLDTLITLLERLGVPFG